MTRSVELGVLAYGSSSLALKNWGTAWGVSNRGVTYFIVERSEFDNDTLLEALDLIRGESYAHLSLLGLLSPRMNDQSLSIIDEAPRLSCLLIDRSYYSETALTEFEAGHPDCRMDGNVVVTPLVESAEEPTSK